MYTLLMISYSVTVTPSLISTIFITTCLFVFFFFSIMLTNFFFQCSISNKRVQFNMKFRIEKIKNYPGWFLFRIHHWLSNYSRYLLFGKPYRRAILVFIRLTCGLLKFQKVYIINIIIYISLILEYITKIC